jgi:hypothetical protein
MSGLRRVKRWASWLGFAVEVSDGTAGADVSSIDQCPVVIASDGRVLASGRLKRLGRRLVGERLRS